MVIAREWFTYTNAVGAEVGSRVRHEDGRVGTIEHIYFGVEETWRVRLDSGDVVSWYPAEGLDSVEVVT